MATTATYVAADSRVAVHVLDTVGRVEERGRIAGGVSAAMGPQAQVTGVEVTSPTGGRYTGLRVRSGSSEVYVFDKASGGVRIIVYAPDAAAMPVADRLAANIGNGEGLLEDPDATASLSALPPTLPPGVELIDTSIFSGGQLTGSLDELKESLGVSFGAEAGTLLDQVRSLIPGHITQAHYRDASRRDLNLVVGDYGGSLKAWATWMMMRATVGLSGLSAAKMAGGDALTNVTGGTQYVFFRRGATLGVASGPAGGTVLQLAESTQP
jgi:hypothetical protein